MIEKLIVRVFSSKMYSFYYLIIFCISVITAIRDLLPH